MDTSYYLKCKRKTRNINSKGFLTKDKKYLVKSLCNIYKSKKLKFISKQQAEGFYQIHSVKYSF